MNIRALLDELTEQNHISTMSVSIETALHRVKNSSAYIDTLNSDFGDEMTLQNMEHEAIYYQAYADCVMQLICIENKAMPPVDMGGKNSA